MCTEAHLIQINNVNNNTIINIETFTNNKKKQNLQKLQNETKNLLIEVF